MTALPPLSATGVRASCLPSIVVNRRTLSLGLLGGALTGGEGNDVAAGRRAPAPPPTGKKDPSVSGVRAKVLASKKRKEAMKEEVQKLRQRGKSLQEAPPPPPPQSE